ncbi:sensor histidine kinase [Nakamurella sp.]|uniref:sensor histidine kinase n=1 Tax=Nakamurella sp. TaxID=1869182 RepID=UPI003B3AB11C
MITAIRPAGAAAPPDSSLRDALLAIGGLMGVLVYVELAVPGIAPVGAASVLDAIAVTAFTGTGLVAWRRRPHNRTGRLLVATAAALLVAGMNDDQVPGLQVLGRIAESLPLAVLIHLLLAYPSGRLAGRAARVTAAAGYAVALGLQYPRSLLPPAASDALWNVQAGLGLIVLIATFALVSRGLAGTPTAIRRQLAPFVLAGCAMLALIAGSLVVLHRQPAPDQSDLAVLVQVAAVSVLPFAFLAGMLVGAFGRAGELEELARGLADASAEPALLDELVARALGDPSAQVAWSPPAGAGSDPVDSRGVPMTGPDGPPFPATDAVPAADAVPAVLRAGAPARRGGWPIGPAGRPVGGLSYDRSVIADEGLVATVAGPLGLAMDNRRLVVDLRAAVRDLDEAAERLRESRRRIVVAADAERRRIARDLHDGPQQRIVLIGIDAQRLGRRAGDPDRVRDLAEQITEQLRTLLDDLRALVQGIMPATLTERGLAAAVTVLAESMPVPVRLRLDPDLGRLPAEVESTGYFMVAEALTNVVKHAAAGRIEVELHATGGRLAVTVTDDGRGPAGAVPGFGLRSLRDRVGALDGTVTLRPGPAGGTRLRAEFACA